MCAMLANHPTTITKISTRTMVAVAQMLYVMARACLISINTIPETENRNTELETGITRGMQTCREMEQVSGLHAGPPAHMECPISEHTVI